jgi:hypothetical protein
MSAYRLVDAAQAGPHAVGILAPPGRRTVLILRPRSLEWDLLLVQGGKNGAAIHFRELGREEADAAVEVLYSALLRWCQGGTGEVGATAAPQGQGFHVRAQIGPCPLVACRRVAGEPYRAATFSRPAEAQRAAEALSRVLRPAAGAGQEIYVNLKHFARGADPRPPAGA